MEGPQLPPPSTSAAIENKEKPEDRTSTWHRPTNSLPHLPSSSQVSSLPPHSRQHSLNLFPSLSSCSPPPNPIPDIETYVVQVPRDQVYWTPPSENAKIVERRINNDPRKRKKRICSRRLIWFFIVILIAGFIICAIALIIRFVFRPEPPVFHVKKLAKSRYFDIMLTSKNPTSNMWVTYKGIVSLTFKNKNLGQGNFSELSQTAEGYDIVNLKLEGSKNEMVLLSEPVRLVLKMELSAGYGSGLVKHNKEVAVSCDVEVNGLLVAKEVEIVSERCGSEFTK